MLRNNTKKSKAKANNPFFLPLFQRPYRLDLYVERPHIWFDEFLLHLFEMTMLNFCPKIGKKILHPNFWLRYIPTSTTMVLVNKQ